MNTETLDFVQILRIDNVSLWEIKDHHSTLLDKGPLEVFFSKDFSVNFLRLHKFKYSLDRSLNIVASSDNERQFRSYLLPNIDSCYVLRLGTPSSEPSVVNLETVFENSCQLKRNPDLEANLKDYEEKLGIFARGENFVKQTIIKGKDAISKGFSNVLNNSSLLNPNHMLIRKMDELKLTDADQTVSEQFSRADTIELMEVSNEISKRQDTGFWNEFKEITAITNPDAKVEQNPSLEEANKNYNEGEANKAANEGSEDEKSRLGRLAEKGHAIIDKVKEAWNNKTSKDASAKETEEAPKEEDSQQEEGLIKKISGFVEEHKDSGDLSSETTIQPNREGPSPLDKINEGYGKAVDKIVEKAEDAVEKVEEVVEPKEEGTEEKGKSVVEGVKQKISEELGNVKEKLKSEKEEDVKASQGKSKPSKTQEDQGNSNRTDENVEKKNQEKKIKEEDTKGFTEVTTGFNETVQELKHERGEDEVTKELNSGNPFEPLAHQKFIDYQSGAKKGENVELKESESAGNAEGGEDKSLVEKVKQGLSDASSKISEKVGETKEKIKSVFVQKDKENTLETV